MRFGVRLLAAAATVAPATTAGTLAHAQAIERHLPPAPKVTRPQLEALPPAPSGDERVLAQALTRLVVEGRRSNFMGSGEAPVLIDPSLRIAGAAETTRLSRYLGKPLSRKLISELTTELISAYRDRGYPFVTVTTPPQDITTGALVLQVVEFVGGRVKGDIGDVRTDELRFRQGSAPNLPDLSEDLEWLNRFPFHSVQPTLRPGADFGEVDLQLQSLRRRRWTVYAGVADSGGYSTGRSRYFAGVGLGGVTGERSLVTVQATGSGDAFQPEGHSYYRSLAARYAVAVAARAEFEMTADWLKTDVEGDPFGQTRQVLEGALGYRFALSNVQPKIHGWGDLRFGAEARRTATRTLFSEVDVFASTFNVYQVYFGYSVSRPMAGGALSLDAAVRIAPGDLDPASASSRLAIDSGGRAVRAGYTYLLASTGYATRVEGVADWTVTMSVQLASRALPVTEQIAIGGEGAVRGYHSEDGGYDQGVLVRNDLRSLACYGPAALCVRPSVFFDAGVAGDLHGRQQRAASLGIGAAAEVAGGVTLGASLAEPLLAASRTRTGSPSLLFRLTVRR